LMPKHQQADHPWGGYMNAHRREPLLATSSPAHTPVEAAADVWLVDP
jgi:hypothetical protein